VTDDNKDSLSIEDYLAKIGQGRHSAFGKRFRQQFADNRGSAELAMLTAPNEKEYSDFSKIVAIMTRFEKTHPDEMTEDQVQDIAKTVDIELSTVQIFINGFVLARRQNKQ